MPDVFILNWLERFRPKLGEGCLTELSYNEKHISLPVLEPKPQILSLMQAIIRSEVELLPSTKLCGLQMLKGKTVWQMWLTEFLL